MEFLKEILGDDLFEQVKTKVSSYNEKADKDKKISIVNVNNGEYVAKAKYTSLETDLNNTKTSLDTANTTISDLKKNNGDNATLQAKITEYETAKTESEKTYKENLAKLVKENAIRDALYKENAKHPDLLLSKFDLSKILLDEKGENIISGLSEQITSHKESYKDLFGNTNDGAPYKYNPASGDNTNGGVADFVGIIKENQARKL